MFTPAEIKIAEPIIEGFKETLLTGDYRKCINYIKSKEQLGKIYNSNFDKNKRASEIMLQVEPEDKENTIQYILFNMLMLWHDEYWYQPWLEMQKAFGENSLLEAFECLLIYHNLRKRNLLNSSYEKLKADLFGYWDNIIASCKKNGYWIEAFYAGYQQACISDEYIISYLTLIDYNIDKFDKVPLLKHLNGDSLLQETKSFFKRKLSNEELGNWMQAILYELDGDLENSIESRIDRKSVV